MLTFTTAVEETWCFFYVYKIKCKVVLFAFTLKAKLVFLADSNSLQLHWTSLDLRSAATATCAKWLLITSMAFWRRMLQRRRSKKLWRKYAASSLMLTGPRCVWESALYEPIFWHQLCNVLCPSTVWPADWTVWADACPAVASNAWPNLCVLGKHFSLNSGIPKE